MSARPTLCFLTGTLNALAGAERMTAVIANALAQRGYEVHILSLWDPASCFDLEPSVRHHALFTRRPSFKTHFVPTVLGIRHYVRHHRVDVLIEVDTMLTLFTLPACAGLPVRRIAWEHCNFDQDLGRQMRRLARRLAARSCQHVVVLTQRDREKWQQALGCRNVVVIPNALSFPLPVEPAARTSHVALAVGRLTYAKGFDVLLRAWQLVGARCPDWQLEIVGDGELRDELVALRDELNLQASVRFLPARPELSAVYRGASLFCLSSRYEGFGLVLIEAMAYGLPVVAADCETGPREVLGPDGAGVLVPPNDAPALAEAMCQLMSDPRRAATISAAARRRAARFDKDAVAQAWQALLAAHESPD